MSFLDRCTLDMEHELGTRPPEEEEHALGAVGAVEDVGPGGSAAATSPLGDEDDDDEAAAARRAFSHLNMHAAAAENEEDDDGGAGSGGVFLSTYGRGGASSSIFNSTGSSWLPSGKGSWSAGALGRSDFEADDYEEDEEGELEADEEGSGFVRRLPPRFGGGAHHDDDEDAASTEQLDDGEGEYEDDEEGDGDEDEEADADALFSRLSGWNGGLIFGDGRGRTLGMGGYGMGAGTGVFMKRSPAGKGAARRRKGGAGRRRGGASDDSEGESTDSASAAAALANLAAPVKNALELLSIDRPSFPPVVLDRWVRDPAQLGALLDVLVRPVDSDAHAGAGGTGLEAVVTAVAHDIEAEAKDAPAGVLARAYRPYGWVDFAAGASSSSSSSSLPSVHVNAACPASSAPPAPSPSASPLGHGHGGSGAHGSSAAPSWMPMCGAISQAHAAAFSAAVEDAQHRVEAARARIRAGPSGSTTALVPASGAAGGAAATPTSEAGAASPTTPSTTASAASSAAPVSLLHPRSKVEIDALQALRRDARAAAAAAAAATAASGEAAAPASPGLPSVTPSPVPSTASGVPSPAAVRKAIKAENEAAHRAYRLTRLLCGGTEAADRLLRTAGEDVARAMFRVFSAKAKGSFHHACAVLQRLIQVIPDRMGALIASRSETYLGDMLPYLHHPPVADAVTQLVLVSYLASAHGGSGPSATLRPSMDTPAAGLFTAPDADAAEPGTTDYRSSLAMYGTTGPAPSARTRAVVWNALGSWGFLGVLASHVYRPEYAGHEEHVTAAADVFVQLVHTLASDERASLLLAPLGHTPACMRGLLHAACWPAAGVDYPFSGRMLPGTDVDAGYYRDGRPLAPPADDEASASADPLLAVAGTLASAPARQREAMRLVQEVLALASKEAIRQPLDNGMAVGLGSQEVIMALTLGNRTVENKLAKFNGAAIRRAAVAALPALAHALVRAHKVLHSGAALAKTPAPKAVPVVAGGAGTPGSVAGTPSALTSPASTTGGGGGKKKSKNKKKKGKGGNGGGAAGGAATPSGAGDDDSEGEDGGATTSSPAATPRPEETAVVTASTAAVPAPSPAAPAPAPRSYRHPGHAYTVPFGEFRLRAAQVIAGLVKDKAELRRPPPLVTVYTPPPKREVEEDDEDEDGESVATTASPAGVGSPAGKGHHHKKGGKGHGKKGKGGKGHHGHGHGKKGGHGGAHEADEAHADVTDRDTGAKGDLMATWAAALEQLNAPGIVAVVSCEGGSASGAAALEDKASTVEPPCTPVKGALVPSSSVSSAAAGGGEYPVAYDPVELWSALVQWCLLYAHTNLYHLAFYDVLLTALRHSNEPTLRALLQHARLLTTFVQHYEATTPLPPSAGGHLPRSARSPSGDCSAARGLILKALNAVRLMGQSNPPGAFLPTYLRDHATWAAFLPRLRRDTEAMLTPQVPPPPKKGGLDGSLSSLASLMNPAAFQALMSSGLGGLGLGMLGKNAKAAAGPKPLDTDLGSSYAKELGLEGVDRYVEPAGGAGASPGSGKGGRSRASSADLSPGGGAGSDSLPDVDTLLESIESDSSGGGKGGGKKGGKGGKKGKGGSVGKASVSLDAVSANMDMLDVD